MVYHGSDKNYREIADLEYDTIFLEALQSQKIEVICNHFSSLDASIMRVTMMD